MPTFNISDRVFLSSYGIGSVDWMSSEHYGVVFDSLGKVLVRRDHPDLRLATPEDEAQMAEYCNSTGSVQLPATTKPFLVFEEGDDEIHSMGSHWMPFFDDAMFVVEHLPELLRVATHNPGHLKSPSSPPPAELIEERGFLLEASTTLIADLMHFTPQLHRRDHLIPWQSLSGSLVETQESAQAYSERNTGIALVVALSRNPGEANQFRSMFPYCKDGMSHDVELKRVLVWADGVEAQLEARIGNASISFYDTEFAANRSWYRRDGKYQFLFAAIAYDAGPAQVRTFSIPRTVEHFEGMHWLTGEHTQPEFGALEERYSMEDMVGLLPVDGWDVDDYEFHGEIKEIWGMSMLGQRAWRLRTVVMRGSMSEASGEDGRFDIVVTERAWKGHDPPRVGQAIAGHFWLQGRLLRNISVV
ncbi:MAG TPA: hypothetical protein PKE27_06370 [Povalibacter sp.]|uniref:hypothetical protein n=1 Tax=Povalibacter sp. TaxID=1962978 RepID=UPI002C910B9B|nr:hypothetical protein [Povalibacter sp.]HMN44174.1 hypothetical protein [Povalibacter sp.]